MSGLTIHDVIRTGFPGADMDTIDHILWGRTPYPMGQVTAQSLYKAASRYRRACESNVRLCDHCDNRVISEAWECDRCASSRRRAAAPAQTEERP